MATPQPACASYIYGPVYLLEVKLFCIVYRMLVLFFTLKTLIVCYSIPEISPPLTDHMMVSRSESLDTLGRVSFQDLCFEPNLMLHDIAATCHNITVVLISIDQI